MTVTIHPKSPVWPENILRFHLAFEFPMDTEFALRFVDLFRASGERVHGAFVDLPNGLWTTDQKVLTILFHPGRVKRGLRANIDLGRAIQEGERLAIRVSGGMRDAYGNRLGKDVWFEFTTGPAVLTSFEKIQMTYRVNGNDQETAIRIPSDRPIDWLSARSSLFARDANGAEVPVLVEDDTVGLLLRPESAWPHGTIYVSAGEKLEDSCGNRQTVPFEINQGDT